MTTNHHTAIANGAPANASTFNTPLGQLDNAIETATTTANTANSSANASASNLSNLIAGASGFTQLSLSTSPTLTISSGAITVTRSRHFVDTEAAASYDDLDTINGGVEGDVLVLESVISTRVVVVKNGTGNIFLNGMDVFLDDERKALTLLFDGTQWVLIGNPPQRINRRQMQIVFNEATNLPIGHGAVSVFGTPTRLADSDGVYTVYTSAATAAQNGGVQVVAFTLYQARHHPSMTIWLRTGANIAGIRWFVGLTSGGPLGSDTLTPSVVSGVAFRYSTVVGDVGWRPVTSNGTNSTIHAQLGGNLAINTAYKLQVSIVNGVAYFVLNDTSYFSSALTTPASTTDLGWSAQLGTQENVAKAVGYRRILLETDV